MRRFAVLLPLLILPACATILKGTTQEVKLTSEPAGAACTFDRTGAQLGVVPATPGRVMLQRSSLEMVVTCTKPGFEKTAQTVKGNFNGATFGNILLGGIVGAVVDASSGANYSFPDVVHVTMAATPAAPAAPAPFVPGSPIRLQPSQPGA